ncbi:hypothetical protein [[Eubacterium] cellulosolvens]
MVQKKRPPAIKWNPYSVGETKNLIMKEIKEIVAKKEYRQKLGLEMGVFREFKGNPHWNLLINIQLAEILANRLNSDIKSVFLQATKNLNNTGNTLANITQQLKQAEYNLGNVTTVSNNNVIKTIRGEITKLNKTVNDILKMQNDMKTFKDEIQEIFDNTSKVLNETLNENLQKFLKEVCDSTEASQNVITGDIKSFKDFSGNKFDEVSDLVKVNFSEFNEQFMDMDYKNTESVKKLSEKVTKVEDQIQNSNERLMNFQEATNNMFDDQQKILITEFQQGVGGIMKQNLENFEKIKKVDSDQTKEIIIRMDESTENLTSIIEATNEHLEKLNTQTKENIKSSEDNVKKELKNEITDVRAILSTIRSDIELMKSVLTKLDTKIH